MEETLHPIPNKVHVLTHILTSPSTTPSLHSQLFIATQVPCYLRWDYPPFLCHSAAAADPDPDPKPTSLLLLRWSFSLFLRRASRPQVTWRSTCPYQQPPPPVLAAGVEEARWGDEDRLREYARRRFRRKRRVSPVHPVLPVLVPNALVFLLLLWNPFPEPP